MIVNAHSSFLKGSITAPPSKSMMQRAVALAMINKGTTTIFNPGSSKDDKASIDIIKQSGCNVINHPDRMIIESSGVPSANEEINCGESGLALRMFTPVISAHNDSVIVNGEGSLLRRNMGFFDQTLNLLGVDVQSNNGLLPLKLKGKLHPRDIVVDGSESSQYITGLLLAFASATTLPVDLTVRNLKSRSYIDLTADMMNQAGLKLERNQDIFTVFPAKTKNDITFYIEGDWSNTAFLIVAGAISGDLTINGLNKNSFQGDKVIVDIVRDAGADISWSENGLTINSKNSLRSFTFDATNYPDLFPPLVVLAMAAEGTSKIKGIHRLINKESNRVESLVDVISKMGGRINYAGDEMLLQGSKLSGAIVSSHQDHRIAMACAIAALIAEGEMKITGSESVNKSWPKFFTDLITLGAAFKTDLHE